MKRVAAVLGAVAMVVGALVLRGTIDLGGGDGGGPNADGGDGPDTNDAAVTCAADVGGSCQEAFRDRRVVVETAADTADRLLAARGVDELAGGAWVTTAAWAELVVAERVRLGLPALFDEPVPIASSPALLAVWADRRGQLTAACGLPADALGPRCLAEQEGTTLAGGDRVRPASPDVDTALGLPLAGAQATGIFFSPDFAANDFDATFRTLAASLAMGQTTDPLVLMRTQGPGRVTAAMVVGATAETVTSTFGTIELVRPDPEVRVDLVVLVAAGAPVPDRVDDLGVVLRSAGWDPPGTGADGLPNGGVLAAIRTVWAR